MVVGSIAILKTNNQKGIVQMKIGIVTLFAVPNYGAMLQAYALWQYLKALGHEVEFVDYKFTSAHRSSFIRSVISRSPAAIKGKLKKYVRHTIIQFADHFPRTQRLCSAEELNTVAKPYEVLIVGSDQIWSPRWAAKWDPAFVFLHFGQKCCRRIAYAASFGVSRWNCEESKPYVSELLKCFSAISVREASGVKIIEELSNRKDIKVCPDPTLLYDASFYNNRLSLGEREESPYIFEYLLDEFSDNSMLITEIKRILGVEKVVSDKCIASGVVGRVCGIMGIYGKIPVQDWICRLANASFVLTNSFHGTVFSIIFHRPFISLLLSGNMSEMNERITGLLDYVGLRNRIVFDMSSIEDCVLQEIDWDVVDSRIDIMRHEGRCFIEECLS